MDPIVFVLILVAAALHVAWNVIIKTSGDPLRAAGGGIILGAAILVPAGIVGWFAIGRPPVPPEAIVLAAISGVLEAVYFVSLSAAYRHGDLSVVYPIARGTAPLIAVAIGVTILGERLGPIGVVGVGALLVGILALQRPWEAIARIRAGESGRQDTAAMYALITGVLIAAYSAVDRVGTRLVEPWVYATLLWIAMSIALVVTIRILDRVATTPPVLDASDRRRGMIGGVLTLAAYLLVLFAYSIAPLTVVAPLRESAIVLASGWGAIKLREATGTRAAALRVGAAAVVVLGAVLLALDR